jgi:hypothetical protein
MQATRQIALIRLKRHLRTHQAHDGPLFLESACLTMQRKWNRTFMIYCSNNGTTLPTYEFTFLTRLCHGCIALEQTVECLACVGVVHRQPDENVCEGSVGYRQKVEAHLKRTLSLGWESRVTSYRCLREVRSGRKRTLAEWSQCDVRKVVAIILRQATYIIQFASLHQVVAPGGCIQVAFIGLRGRARRSSSGLAACVQPCTHKRRLRVRCFRMVEVLCTRSLGATPLVVSTSSCVELVSRIRMRHPVLIFQCLQANVCLMLTWYIAC